MKVTKFSVWVGGGRNNIYNIPISAFFRKLDKIYLILQSLDLFFKHFNEKKRTDAKYNSEII